MLLLGSLLWSIHSGPTDDCSTVSMNRAPAGQGQLVGPFRRTVRVVAAVVAVVAVLCHKSQSVREPCPPFTLPCECTRAVEDGHQRGEGDLHPLGTGHSAQCTVAWFLLGAAAAAVPPDCIVQQLCRRATVPDTRLSTRDFLLAAWHYGTN